MSIEVRHLGLSLDCSESLCLDLKYDSGAEEIPISRPWYISTTGVDPGPQKAFEKIFYEGEVDMYLTGHQHVYQRNKPVYNCSFQWSLMPWYTLLKSEQFSYLNLVTIDPNGLNNPRWVPFPRFEYIRNFSELNGLHLPVCLELLGPSQTVPQVIMTDSTLWILQLPIRPYNSQSEQTFPRLKISTLILGLPSAYGWSRLTFHNRVSCMPFSLALTTWLIFHFNLNRLIWLTR